MGAESTPTHTDESLPGADAPPAEKVDNSAMGKARVFAHAKRTLIAIAVAGYATLKIGKYALVWLWDIRNVDSVQDAPNWALHHWLIVLAVSLLVFAAVFSITRFVLGKL